MKNDEIFKKLNDEIERLLNKLNEMTPGTQEYDEVEKSLDRLYRLRTEEMKVVGDIGVQREKNEVERAINEARINADIDNNADRIVEDRRQHKIDKIVSVSETGAKIVGLLVVGIFGFMFEEHGRLVSPTFKNLRDTFRPKL